MLLIICMCLSSCRATAVTSKDADIIFQNFIGLNVGNEGRSNLDKYNDWGDLYNKYYGKVSGNSYDSNDLRIYLVLVFIAHDKSMAETQADISQTFLPIFKENSTEIVKIMIENKFLIGSICSSIKGYFVFFSQDLESQKEFKSKYLPVILKEFSKYGVDGSCFLNL
jgi:hypothetical protein